MPTVFAGQELELLKHGFRRCVYLQGYCSECGPWRAVVALVPHGEFTSCPRCGRPHCNFGELGWGYTRRTLPHFHVWMAAPRVDSWPADDPLPKPRVKSRVVGPDEYISADGRLGRLSPSRPTKAQTASVRRVTRKGPAPRQSCVQ